MRRASSFAVLLVAALAAPAFAQAPPAGTPTRIRGTVESLADHTLTVKTREGGSAAVTLSPEAKVRSVVRKTLADVKEGDTVGITSVAGTGGGQQAVEVHILPKGARIGQFPWDLSPGSLMTNGAVAQVSGPPSGRVLTLSFNGKKAQITVPPDAAVVAFGPEDTGLLKPGAAVVVFAQKHPDGSLSAANVAAEKDGVKPPM